MIKINKYSVTLKYSYGGSKMAIYYIYKVSDVINIDKNLYLSRYRKEQLRRLFVNNERKDY